MFGNLPLIQKIIVWAIPVIFAITLHEAAHGWVASLLGDKTAKMLGRLSLNPIRHIDPVGTIILPLGLLAVGSVIFGWAKPVPVSTKNFKNPQRDMALVAIAGPVSNLLMALIWALILKLSLYLPANLGWLALSLIYMGHAGVFINLWLMILNILPIPPLDGSKVLGIVLPKKYASLLLQYERYGMILLLLLAITGVLFSIMEPIFNVSLNVIAYLFHFS